MCLVLNVKMAIFPLLHIMRDCPFVPGRDVLYKCSMNHFYGAPALVTKFSVGTEPAPSQSSSPSSSQRVEHFAPRAWGLSCQVQNWWGYQPVLLWLGGCHLMSNLPPPPPQTPLQKPGLYSEKC